MSDRSKPNKSDRTNQNCQFGLLIESGAEVLNELIDKTNQSDQRRLHNFKFGDLIKSELAQVPSGHIKDIVKLDMQK